MKTYMIRVHARLMERIMSTMTSNWSLWSNRHMIGLMEINIKGVHRPFICFLTAINRYLPLLGELLEPDVVVKAKHFEP
jgi:hypothetical protein